MIIFDVLLTPNQMLQDDAKVTSAITGTKRKKWINWLTRQLATGETLIVVPIGGDEERSWQKHLVYQPSQRHLPEDYDGSDAERRPGI